MSIIVGVFSTFLFVGLVYAFPNGAPPYACDHVNIPHGEPDINLIDNPLFILPSNDAISGSTYTPGSLQNITVMLDTIDTVRRRKGRYGFILTAKYISTGTLVSDAFVSTDPSQITVKTCASGEPNSYATHVKAGKESQWTVSFTPPVGGEEDDIELMVTVVDSNSDNTPGGDTVYQAKIPLIFKALTQGHSSSTTSPGDIEPAMTSLAKPLSPQILDDIDPPSLDDEMAFEDLEDLEDLEDVNNNNNNNNEGIPVEPDLSALVNPWPTKSSAEGPQGPQAPMATDSVMDDADFNVQPVQVEGDGEELDEVNTDNFNDFDKQDPVEVGQSESLTVPTDSTNTDNANTLVNNGLLPDEDINTVVEELESKPFIDEGLLDSEIPLDDIIDPKLPFDPNFVEIPEAAQLQGAELTPLESENGTAGDEAGLEGLDGLEDLELPNIEEPMGPLEEVNGGELPIEEDGIGVPDELALPDLDFIGDMEDPMQPVDLDFPPIQNKEAMTTDGLSPTENVESVFDFAQTEADIVMESNVLKTDLGIPVDISLLPLAPIAPTQLALSTILPIETMGLDSSSDAAMESSIISAMTTVAIAIPEETATTEGALSTTTIITIPVDNDTRSAVDTTIPAESTGEAATANEMGIPNFTSSPSAFTIPIIPPNTFTAPISAPNTFTETIPITNTFTAPNTAPNTFTEPISITNTFTVPINAANTLTKPITTPYVNIHTAIPTDNILDLNPMLDSWPTLPSTTVVMPIGDESGVEETFKIESVATRVDDKVMIALETSSMKDLWSTLPTTTVAMPIGDGSEVQETFKTDIVATSVADQEVPVLATQIMTDIYNIEEYGYNTDGYNREGYDIDGYDREGYDIDGYDQQGYDIEGYDREGYTKEGYDEAGFDREGYDESGYNDTGYDREGYNHEGYNKYGYDREGFDIIGLNERGCDKNGFCLDRRRRRRFVWRKIE